MKNLKRNKPNVNFINVFLRKGELVVKVDQANNETVTRKNKKGDTVHELIFDEIEGLVSKIDFETFEYENNKYHLCKLSLRNPEGNDIYSISMDKNNFLTVGLINRILNTKIGETVSINTYYFEKEKRSAVVVKQSGEKITPLYDKDDLPLIDKIEVNDKIAYDFKKVYKFLDVKIEEFNQQLGEYYAKKNQEKATTTEIEPRELTPEMSADDLPF